MTTESNLESSEGVRTYRGRTLEEILPQIREELGPDAIILREREGLVGGVGGFFAQRFIEVEARRGEDSEPPRSPGSAIDIYDEDEEPGFEAGPSAGLSGQREQPLLPAGEEQLDIRARRQTPDAEAPARSEPRPFVPPELQRERIIPRDPQGEPAPPTRRFETDVFLERLREASQMLPDEDEADEAGGTADETSDEPEGVGPESTRSESAEPESAEPDLAPPDVTAPEIAPPARERQHSRRTPPERKPRGPASRGPQSRAPQSRGPRPAPRSKAAPASRPPKAPETPQPQAPPTDPWTAAMAALVAEPEPETATPPPARPTASRLTAGPTEPGPTAGPTSRRPTAVPSVPRPAAGPTAPDPGAPRGATPQASPNPYEALRQRPSSLRVGLPTESPAARPVTPAAPTPPPASPIPPPTVAPLEIRARREGVLRGVLARLFGGRFGASTLPRPSAPHPLDATAAQAIATGLSARGASQPWTAQLIGTAGAHGTALSGSLLAAAEAELARRIVPAPSLPATGAAVAFIGAGGSGKTRCTAALASAYSRASTLGVTVIAVDNPHGARELTRLLNGDGVPVLSLSGDRARQAVAAYRAGGFVIVDTPTATPTDAAAIAALGASLAPLELDATFVTLPATLGPQAARRALASFGRLDPSAVAITHADETDQLAVAVEIAIAHRIPLAYLHSGSDHRSALSTVDAGTLARQLLGS